MTYKLARDDWKDHCRTLDYPDREIIVMHEPGQHPWDGKGTGPGQWADFDPQPYDPDPAVWPLEELDPGPSDTPVEELYCLTNTTKEPSVKWVTEDFLEAKYGHNPFTPPEPKHGSISDLLSDPDPAPRGKRRDPADHSYTSTKNPGRLRLSDDRRTFFDRLARLWNGERVQGQHLLWDKAPDWDDLFGDLDQSELEDIHTITSDVERELWEAFHAHDWYACNQNIYCTKTYIDRQTIRYDVTNKGRTLINRNDSFPELRGDPLENLRHRFGVGLAALLLSEVYHYDTHTYHDVAEYTLDVYAESATDDGGNRVAIEVVTAHNNYELYRQTYEKLRELLEEYTIYPMVVFDTRTTAYRCLNHWHDEGLLELPTGRFDSHPKIDWAREKTMGAYRDDEQDFYLGEWYTVNRLWRALFDEDDSDAIRAEADLDRRQVVSLDW